MIDFNKIRNDFPILSQKVNGYPLIYFDNAATSQKPKQMIDALVNYYTTVNSNVHRGRHFLSDKATDLFEKTRKKIKIYFNALHEHEIIFTRGTTESINLVASCMTPFIKPLDEIIISGLEHHSNIIPWQILCERTGAVLKVIPIDDSGALLMDEYDMLLNEKTKIVAVNHISNTLGIINPIAQIIEKAHRFNAKVLIDGAQSAAHIKVDLQNLNCDFFTASSHKMLGPTGVGFLYGKQEILNQFLPYQTGGEMVKECTLKKNIYQNLPYKFEAGTPNIADVIGFSASLDYIENIGIENINIQENDLLHYATEKLNTIPKLKIYGTALKKKCIISFNITRLHHYDLGFILNKMGIALRTGMHCTQPIMDRFKVEGMVRASLSFYNNREEIDTFVETLKKAINTLS